MKIALAAALACFTGSLATAAAADPRLDEQVYTPYIETHVLEAGTRFGGENGGRLGGAQTLVGELEYGVNDRLSLAVVGMADKVPGESMSLQGLGVEGVYALGKIPGLGVDTAAYLEYTHGLNGGDDAVEAKLLAARRFGRVRAVVNLIMERPLGVADENYASYGYAAALTWRVAGSLRLGAEAFGDLGSDHGFLRGPQGAYVGPTVRWGWRPHASPVALQFNLGWLKAAGADRTEADSQFRLGLEIERHF